MQRGAASSSAPTNLWVARLCAAAVLVGGCVSALGWVMNMPRLADWLNSGIVIKFNTAICLVILSVGLLFASYYPRYLLIVRIAGVTVFLIAGVTLLQTILGVSFGIDTLFFNEAPGARATIAPGRMGVPASTSLMLLGTSLVLSTLAGRRRWGPVLVTVSLCLAAPSIAGYIFGANELYTVPRVTGISLQTAAMLVTLAVGIAAVIPEHGIAAAILRRDGGGMLLRRSLPPLVIFLFVMSWFLLQARLRGYFDPQFNAAIRTVLEILLLTGVLWWTANRVSETQSLAAEAQNARSEIELQRRIVEAQETERKRLSRDLHDQVGQEVTGLRFALAKLGEEDAGQAELIGGIKKVRAKVEKLDAEISNLAWRMRPAVLDTDGILVGLRRLGEECSAIHAIDFDLQTSGRQPEMPPEVETNIYRIAQESMNNIVKHANARGIGVTLDFVDGEVRLAIEDDGDGFVESEGSIHDTDTQRLGLVGMRERAAIVGGTLEIETAPGAGTTVLVRIPLKER